MKYLPPHSIQNHRSEEERVEALDKISGHSFKGCSLEAKVNVNYILWKINTLTILKIHNLEDKNLLGKIYVVVFKKTNCMLDNAYR